MNYTTLVQAIAQQGIATNSNMKLKSLTFEKKILRMMEALCKGFVMKGRHCTNTKDTCTNAHIPNLAGLPKADQDWLVNFVKNNK